MYVAALVRSSLYKINGSGYNGYYTHKSVADLIFILVVVSALEHVPVWTMFHSFFPLSTGGRLSLFHISFSCCFPWPYSLTFLLFRFQHHFSRVCLQIKRKYFSSSGYWLYCTHVVIILFLSVSSRPSLLLFHFSANVWCSLINYPTVRHRFFRQLWGEMNKNLHNLTFKTSSSSSPIHQVVDVVPVPASLT